MVHSANVGCGVTAAEKDSVEVADNVATVGVGSDAPAIEFTLEDYLHSKTEYFEKTAPSLYTVRVSTEVCRRSTDSTVENASKGRDRPEWAMGAEFVVSGPGS